MPLLNKVLVVEDHPIFLKGLVHLLGSEPGFVIVGEARDRRQALDGLAEKKPDLVLVDLTLGDESGLDLIKDIKALESSVRILVLSMHDERFYAERALAAGAHGYCMKEEAAEHILAALNAVASGKVWLSQRLREKAADFPKEKGSPELVLKLSDREFQVFTFIGKGLGTVEIAAKLKLSAKTIDTHKENIKLKLKCGTSQDLRQYAIEWQSGQGRA